MATAFQTAPYSVEITEVPDTMDLHSDSGLDFGDGDGDIDLDLQSNAQQDDDLSIYDAATDIGLEVQTASGDHDDFMVDNEDVIEEDVVNYDDDDDVAVIDVEQQSANQSGSGEQEMVNNEDDLIDYSDDEEQTMWNESEHAASAAEVNIGENQSAAEDDQNEDQTAIEKTHQADGTVTQDELPEKNDNTTSRSVESNQEEETRVNDDEFQAFAEEQEHGSETDQDVTTYVTQSTAPEEADGSDNVYGQSDGLDNAHDDTSLNEPAQVQQELHIHPVTVNYDSAELWLFKTHDYEASGDFLVEDESLAHKPVSSLLDACRVALGSDLTDDMELGFRLDNFRNIELYQEHTSCAFITLEHLLTLYQQLHVQDGVSSPESFYMTLLFRPRVSALLNELTKAAAEGIGHLGLDRAISAGLTAFNAHLSHNSTEPVLEDWDNAEEQQEQDAHGDDELNQQVEHVGEDEGYIGEVQKDTYEENDDKYQPEPYEESHVEEGSQPQVQSPGNTTTTRTANSANEETAVADGRTSADDATTAKSLADRSHSNSAHASPVSHHDEDDLIDYSDDEADPEANQHSESQVPQHSSSSSTVQGDVTAADQIDAENPDTGNGNTNGEATYGFEGESRGEIHTAYDGFDGQSFDQEYADDNAQLHEFESAQVEEQEEYPTGYPTQTNNEITNQYDDAETGNVDQQHVFSLAGLEDDSNYSLAQSAAIDDAFTGEDDFLDFNAEVENADFATNGQVESLAGEDDIDNDDEGGAAGQAPVSASAAAAVESVDTLSSEPLELSPQGQKRTIDEVGIDVHEATDISGTLPCKRRMVTHNTNWL
jgi:hypothetical protein